MEEVVGSIPTRSTISYQTDAAGRIAIG